jgi:hypothetical protein
VTVCAIMQPTYLPWIGYFDLIDQADSFVFLDDAQFSRQSWQQRNRIRSARGLEWMTVPVKKSGRFGQAIRDVEIDVGTFPHTHIGQLERCYRGTSHFAELWPGLSRLICSAEEHRSLSRLNRDVICWIAQQLRIRHATILASELDVTGGRSERLVAICQAVGATAYLTPPGSVEYLSEDRVLFTRAGLPVLVQRYEHPTWTQAHAPFLPFASAIDLLFNAAPEALVIVRSGRREPVPLDSWELAS